MTHRVGLDVQSVIQAAADLADARGIEEITLAMLATQLGVRTPTLYHYVNGLDGLRHDINTHNREHGIMNGFPALALVVLHHAEYATL